MFEFYKRNTKYCILFISFLCAFLIQYAGSNSWHGLVGWGPRYLFLVIPFLIIPLAASLEVRKNLVFKIIIIILVLIGGFFNLVWLSQDISWFVWGQMGQERGLYALGALPEVELRIHKAVLWSFEYSQLTHGILNLIENPQLDFYFFKVNPLIFLIAIIVIIPLNVFAIIRKLNQE